LGYAGVFSAFSGLEAGVLSAFSGLGAGDEVTLEPLPLLGVVRLSVT